MNCHQSEFLHPFRNKTLLITGGAGYLATGLVSLLKDVDCRIIRLHRQHSNPNQRTAIAKIHDLKGDVRDSKIWEQALKGVDYVFHFAAQTSTYSANEEPVTDHSINVLPMLFLLEACRRRKSTITVCFAGTVTVAGIPQHLPVSENCPNHPLTIYDLHKMMAEKYLRWYSEQGYVHGVTLRLANIYGPGPRSSRADRGILNQMILKSLRDEPLTIYGEGDQVRDYLFVEDASRAFLAAAIHGEELSGKFFVIGSGKGHTIAEAIGMVAERASKRCGKIVQVQHVAPPGGLSPIEQRHFIADFSRFTRATGWVPLYTLEEGIDKTLEAFS